MKPFELNVHCVSLKAHTSFREHDEFWHNVVPSVEEVAKLFIRQITDRRTSVFAQPLDISVYLGFYQQ